jgi:hypothetical protein
VPVPAEVKIACINIIAIREFPKLESLRAELREDFRDVLKLRSVAHAWNPPTHPIWEDSQNKLHPAILFCGFTANCGEE